VGESHLGLVLPGGEYGPLGPALRVPVLALEQVGAEVRTVAYPPARPGGLGEDESRAFNTSVATTVGEMVGEIRRERVTFIAKSRGSMALAALDPSVVRCDDVRAVWVTPAFGLDYVRRGAIAKGWRSLVVAGGIDSFHDPVGHDEVVRALDAWSLVLEGADHLLEVAGDVQATLACWTQVASAVLEFVG
jgi:hypothetical protein